jgi:hypothetical protein
MGPGAGGIGAGGRAFGATGPGGVSGTCSSRYKAQTPYNAKVVAPAVHSARLRPADPSGAGGTPSLAAARGAGVALAAAGIGLCASGDTGSEAGAVAIVGGAISARRSAGAASSPGTSSRRHSSMLCGRSRSLNCKAWSMAASSRSL